MPEAVGGLVLAGGRSSRMGTDKAGLTLGGATMLQRARALLAAVGASPILTSGAGYDLPDPVLHAGPVSGLIALCDHIAAHDAPRSWLILPVDMPLLTADALRPLLRSTHRAAHFTHHPLPLLLRFDETTRTVLAGVRPALTTPRSVAMMRLMESLNAEAIAARDTACLINTNTPAEWQRLAAS